MLKGKRRSPESASSNWVNDRLEESTSKTQIHPKFHGKQKTLQDTDRKSEWMSKQNLNIDRESKTNDTSPEVLQPISDKSSINKRKRIDRNISTTASHNVSSSSSVPLQNHSTVKKPPTVPAENIISQGKTTQPNQPHILTHKDHHHHTENRLFHFNDQIDHNATKPPETYTSTSLKKQKTSRLDIDNSQHLEQGSSKSTPSGLKLKAIFKQRPLDLSPSDQTVYDVHGNIIDKNMLVKRLPSPKVLLTRNLTKGMHTYYKKRRIDLDKDLENSEVNDMIDTNCDLLEDKLMSDSISDLMQPLRSEDLEAYLSTLSYAGHRKEYGMNSQISDIPLRKCQFFIGDELNNTKKNKCEENANSSINNVLKQQVNVIESSQSLENTRRNLFHNSLSESSHSGCDFSSGYDLKSRAIDISTSTSTSVHYDSNNKKRSPKVISPEDISNDFKGYDLDDTNDSSENDSTPTNSFSESSILKLNTNDPRISPTHPQLAKKVSPLTVSRETTSSPFTVSRETNSSPFTVSREATPTSELESHSSCSTDNSISDLNKDFSGLCLNITPPGVTTSLTSNEQLQVEGTQCVSNSGEVTHTQTNIENGISLGRTSKNGFSDLTKGESNQVDVSQEDKTLKGSGRTAQERTGRLKSRESRLCQQLLKKELKKTLQVHDVSKLTVIY